MTAIKITALIEGNLADDPKCFASTDTMPARVGFTILHTERYVDRDTRQWKDGRTTSVRVDFRGPAAERYIDLISRMPGLFVKGTAVIAWGEIADVPNAYVDRDGKPRSNPTLIGTKIVPDQVMNQRRSERRSQQDMQSQSQTPAPSSAAPSDDPWGNVPGQDMFGDPMI